MVLTTTVYAQSNDTFMAKGKGPIAIKYIGFDELPAAKYDLGEYLSMNLKYPKEALENNIQGRVMVKFVVNEDGIISDVEVVRGVHELLDAEAVRVAKGMKPWKPAMQNGKPVKTFFNLPIVFKLDDPEPPKDSEPQ